MDELKVTLQKKIGPFPLWQWIIAIILGVMLGLAVRSRFSQGPEVAATEDPSSLDYLPSQGAFVSASGSGTTDDFLRDVTDLIREQNRALDSLKDNKGDLFNNGDSDGEKTPKLKIKYPKINPVGPKEPIGFKVIDPDAKIKVSIAAAYQAAGFNAPAADSAKMKRLVSEVKRGRSYADITYQLRQFNYLQGKGPNPGPDPQNFRYGA